MDISAQQVSELREKTGLGMMLCKKALIEANGNLEMAVENLRKQGQATLQKRAGKAAKEGSIAIVSGNDCTIMYEVNAETDFVARNEDFVKVADAIGKILLEKRPADITSARALTSPLLGGLSIDAKIQELIAKIGEVITFRRFNIASFAPASERIASYLHGKKIGVLVKYGCSKADQLDSEGFKQLGKDLAMQIAAANPLAVSKDHIAQDVLTREKEIYFTQAQTSGKPEKIWDKIVEGKLVKFFKEVTLLEQPFIREPERSVSDRIADFEKASGAKVTVTSFIRYELGAEE